MDSSTEFAALVGAIRAGEHGAVEELVSRYEAEVRTEIRQRLRRGRIRRLIDSQDVCQSVFASFLIRLANGQYQLETRRDLERLLTRMVRNKVNRQFRRHFAARRDLRRTHSLSGAAPAALLTGGEPSPSERLTLAELVAQANGLLSPEEREIAGWRKKADSWEEIGDRLGATAEAARKRFERAIDRVTESVLGDDV